MQSDARLVDNAEQPKRIRDVLKPISGAAVGNMLEWFDYALYGYLSASIAHIFFPSHDPLISLITTFAAFSVAFITRPLGALFFGSLGDRLGRRDTLVIVVGLISLSTFFVGILPGYASIGIAAPMLLVFLRMLQGFSAGGEVGGAVAFMAEYSPTRKRGFIVGFFSVSGSIGVVLASALSLTIVAIYGQDVVNTWAWRLPFLIAGPIGLLALWLRLRIDETPAFRAHAASEGTAKAPLREALAREKIGILKCFSIAITHGVPYYLILVYLPAYLSSTGRLKSNEVLMASGLAFFVSALVVPFASALSDKIGRRPISLFAALCYFVVAIPAFNTVMTSSTQVAVMAIVGLGVIMGIYVSGAFSLMIELFPTRTRYSSMSIGYNLAMVIFGGSAPLISAGLVKMTGNPSSPAYFLMAAAATSFIAILACPETARVPIDELGKDPEQIKSARLPNLKSA